MQKALINRALIAHPLGIGPGICCRMVLHDFVLFYNGCHPLVAARRDKGATVARGVAVANKRKARRKTVRPTSRDDDRFRLQIGHPLSFRERERALDELKEPYRKFKQQQQEMDELLASFPLRHPAVKATVANVSPLIKDGKLSPAQSDKQAAKELSERFGIVGLTRPTWWRARKKAAD